MSNFLEEIWFILRIVASWGVLFFGYVMAEIYIMCFGVLLIIVSHLSRLAAVLLSTRRHNSRRLDEIYHEIKLQNKERKKANGNAH